MDSSPAVAAAYEAALPADARIERKQMFGLPCAFVNRQMFFGCFAESVIARVGPSRVAALVAQPGMQAFTPMEGRTWEDYVQVAIPADADLLTRLAADALAWTDRLPAKAKKPRAKKKVSAST
jgi:hypothetical protein